MTSPPESPSGLSPSTPPFDHLTEAQSLVLKRQRRGRNIAMLVVLLGLFFLFYAITIVKLTKT